jgi:hypothetical protein
MRSIVLTLAFALLVFSWPRPASAQEEQGSFQVGGQLIGAASGEFDGTDIGIGGRIAWFPLPLIGVEAEMSIYPDDFADAPAFSRRRYEGLYGVTVGPQLGRLRPFAKLRPGFVTFSEASGPFPCPLIFPAPLSCQLAAGQTVFALDIGGGVEWSPTVRTFIRAEAGDRLMRYPGPVRDQDFEVRDDGFFSHDFRFAIGGGVRF